MLFDVDNLCWDKFLCEKLGIPMSILPEPVPSSRIYGRVSKGILGLEFLEGIPICGAIGDQPAALALPRPVRRRSSSSRSFPPSSVSCSCL